MRILICLALAACNTAGATPATTPTANGELRSVGAFHNLAISTVIEATVTIGPVAKLELQGPRDWLAKLETNVVGDTLSIDMPGKHQGKMPKLKALITVPDLSALEISGVASVQIDKLVAKTFDVRISGTGAVNLAGKTDSLRVTVSGSGELMAADLAASVATLAISGSGDATIKASKEVNADVSGTGNIKILGNPVIHKHVTGVAEIN